MTRERVSFAMRLHAGQAEEYKRRHDAIWPDLASVLREAGVSNYSIYLDERSHILFAYLERSPTHKMDDLPNQAVMKLWWAHMADIMAVNPDGSPVVTPLVEMFHLP